VRQPVIRAPRCKQGPQVRAENIVSEDTDCLVSGRRWPFLGPIRRRSGYRGLFVPD
jgi:hypothetical protein